MNAFTYTQNNSLQRPSAPPQAYTRDILVKAINWIQTQPQAVRERATSADLVVSHYLQACRRADMHSEAPVSGEAFREDLRNLAEGLKQFEEPIAPPHTPPSLGQVHLQQSANKYRPNKPAAVEFENPLPPQELTSPAMVYGDVQFPAEQIPHEIPMQNVEYYEEPSQSVGYAPVGKTAAPRFHPAASPTPIASRATIYNSEMHDQAAFQADTSYMQATPRAAGPQAPPITAAPQSTTPTSAASYPLRNEGGSKPPTGFATRHTATVAPAATMAATPSPTAMMHARPIASTHAHRELHTHAGTPSPAATQQTEPHTRTHQPAAPQEGTPSSTAYNPAANAQQTAAHPHPTSQPPGTWQIDARSLAMGRELQQRLNLGTEIEGLRMLITLGAERARELFP